MVNRKITKSLLPLVLLIVGLGIGVSLIRQRQLSQSQASTNKVDLSLIKSVAGTQVGQQFDVDVHVVRTNNLNVSAAKLVINFPSSLKALSITPGSVLTQVLEAGNITSASTSITVGSPCTSTSCTTLTGTGVLAKIRFEALANGTPTISVDSTKTLIAVTQVTTPTSMLGDAGSTSITIAAPTAVATVVPPTVVPTTLLPTATIVPPTAVPPTTVPPTTVPTTAVPTTVPTNTPPTATAAPQTASLNLQIKFQGVNNRRPDKQVRIILKQGADEKYNQTVNAAANDQGTYTLTAVNITPGSYEVFIKGPAHLQKKFAEITLNEGENSQDYTSDSLRGGDINNDNRVDLFDYAVLAGQYRPGAQNSSNADMNFDGFVDLADYTILATNFNPIVTGD